MLALGIDTSTPMVSVALVETEPMPAAGDTALTSPPLVIARRDEPVNNGHGEVLAGLIDAVFHDAGKAVVDLVAIGVGLGPGPFTGLRVGIVTAAAMADALGVPAYGTCSLDVVGMEHAPDDGPFVVVSDARRKQVYWAVYDDVGGRTEGPDIGFPAAVADHVRDRVEEVAGPASEQFAEAFAGFRVAAPRWPDGGRLAAEAWFRAQVGEPAGPLTPMYLRRPDVREPGPPKRVTRQ